MVHIDYDNFKQDLLVLDDDVTSIIIKNSKIQTLVLSDLCTSLCIYYSTVENIVLNQIVDTVLCEDIGLKTIRTKEGQGLTNLQLMDVSNNKLTAIEFEIINPAPEVNISNNLITHALYRIPHSWDVKTYNNPIENTTDLQEYIDYENCYDPMKKLQLC